MDLTTRFTSDMDFDQYLTYLNKAKHKMPAAVYEFAIKQEHYNLDSHESLHDAWLEYLTICEPAEGERKEERCVDIKTCYLGPFHDCLIYVHYKNVRSYSLHSPAVFENPPTYKSGHGDLLTHKISVLENNHIKHEVKFSRGSVLSIIFEDLEHWIEPHTYA
jgi:hypothetical protein